ncbi:MAG: PqqD family protein [Planctomycetes bacterium]|nr:PqqD family protein [Planctomycetota bacterium]
MKMRIGEKDLTAPREEEAMGQAEMCYGRDGDFVAREIGGDTILVPVRGHVGDLESAYVLNATAARIWNGLDGRTSIADIAGEIAEEYEVDRAEAERDATALVASLEAAGLLAPAEVVRG